jgi:signal transduction histidine kinase
VRVFRLSLLEKFALLSFVSVLGSALALGFVSSHVLTRDARDAEGNAIAEVVRHHVRAYGLERLFTDPALRGDREAYAASLGSLLNLPEVVRVKAWGRDATVIWAADPLVVGRRAPNHEELRGVLAGTVRVELKAPTKAEKAREGREFAGLAEVYVPIFSRTSPTEVIGVMEIDKVPARLVTAIRRVTTGVWCVTLGGALLLYLSLLWIVRVAYRSQRTLERRLEDRSAELRERHDTLTFLLQAMAHDLKAAAVAVHGVSGQLLEVHGDALPQDGRRLLRRLQANAEHQERLLSDLATLSRVSKAGRPSDVGVELVREVVEDACADVNGRSAEIIVPERLPTLRCDADQLRVILRHLVANAIAFMGDQPAPRIEVGAEPCDDGVEFSVSDNGIGIDPAYHGKIFEVFERLGGAGDGTGVGLAIVKKIVTEAGGRVWVESVPGRGATFHFTVRRVWGAAMAES